MTTQNLGLPQVAQGKPGAHVRMNEGFAAVDDKLGRGYTENGGFLRLVSHEETLTALSGANVSTPADFIPSRAIVLGVTVRVLADVTGASDFSVGLGAGQSQFGSGLGVLAGSENVGVVGPFAVYSDTAVTLTGTGAFTGGDVLVVAHVLEMGVE